MADYEVTDPSGKTYVVSGPAGASKEDVINVLQQKLALQEQEYQEHMSKTGFIPALKAGAREFIAGTEETFGFPEAGAEQRRKAEEGYQPITSEDIEAAKSRGVLPTIGAYITKYGTEPAGSIIGRYGAPIAAGAVMPEAGVGAIGGAALRGLATTAADLPAEKAENVREQIKSGQSPDQAKAILYALPESLLAGFGFPGTSQLNKLLTPKLLGEAEKLAPLVEDGSLSLNAAKEQLSSKTKEYLANMGVNTAAGAGLMIGTEELRRLQANEPLMTGDEMLKSVIQAGVLSPVFGLLHTSERPKAEAFLKTASNKYERIQNELADLRTLAEDRELTRQQNIKKAELEAEADKLAKEAERRIPLTKQDVLPFETTAEEAKAEQMKGTKQKDFFTEAAETTEPVKTEVITPETFKALDIGHTAAIKKEITGLDLYDRAQNQIIRDKLQNYLNLYGADEAKIAKIESFIDRAKTISDNLPKPKGEENVPGPQVESTGDRTSVSGADVGRTEDTTGAKQGNIGAVDNAGDVTGQPDERARQQSLALEQEPKATEVVTEEEKAPVEEKVPEETLPVEQEAKKTAKELSTLDPNHPLLETLRDPLVTEKDVADAKKEIDTIKSEKESIEGKKAEEPAPTFEPIVDEARGESTEPTGQTKETLMNHLKGIFGSGIDSLTRRGILNIVNSVDEMPAHIKEKLAPNAVGAHSEGKAWLRADAITPERIRAIALHEIGEHYGLEALVGERNYKDILQSVAAGKEKDAIIKKAWEHVAKLYPELPMGERQFLREVVARIGEDAPTHPIWRRIINAVRNFLKQNKYKNLSGEDIQDLVMHSFKTAMNRDIVQEPKKGIEFAKQEPNPEFKRIFEKAGGVYEKTQEPTLFQSFKDNPVNFVKERAKETPKFLDKFETMWLSSIAALQNKMRRGMEALGMPFDEIRKVLLKASDSQALHREAVAHQVLEKGGLRYDPETYKYIAIDKPGSWKGVIEAIKSAADENGISYEEMEKYAHQALIARRLIGVKEIMARADERYIAELAAAKNQAQRDAAEDRWKKSQKVIHLTDAQLAAGEELFNKLKGMDKVVDEWNRTRKNVMDFAIESGLYTESQVEDLLDVMDYVPFYRVEQLENRAGPKEFTRGLLDIAKDKRFMGSKEPVNNVFDNMERWISYTIRKGIGNQSAKDLNNAAMKYLPKGEVYKLGPDEKVPHNLQGNVIGIWDHGSVDRYVYTDPLFVHAFTGMEPIVIPALKGAAKFTDMLRQNIVLNPLFSLGQLSQDAFGAMFVSGVKHPFALPVQALKEFISTLRGTSEAHKVLKEYGAVGVRDYSSAVSRIDAEIAAGLKEPKLMDKLTKPFRALSMASDNAIRQAIYNQTLKETGNKALAIERAFEVINFRRSGASSTVNFLRQTVPFFGAYLQAMNVAAKVIAGKGIAPTEKAEARKILASTMGKVLIAGMIYNVLISEDDGYKKLDPSVRDRRLIIPGTDGMSLPLRNDIFTVFSKILPEHIYQMTMAEGTEDGTKAKKALATAFTNALVGPNVMPQFAKPAVEVITNHNFFTGRPVVGQGLERLDPQYQYTPNTSELSKVLGKSTGTSPMKWDHLIQSYFGYTGGSVLMATDKVMAAGSDRPLPDKSFQDTIASIPGASLFVSREFGTKDKSDFYELRTLVDEAAATDANLKKYKSPEERQAFREEHQKLLQVKAQVNNIDRQLTAIRDQQTRIYEAPESKMSSAEKEVKLRELKEKETRALKNVRELRLRAGL
jgi:Large polyvalent protein associated domain 38